MSDETSAFRIGDHYSNEEIFRSLLIGNAGGIRVKVGHGGRIQRAAVFTSIPTARQLAENPYHDRIEGDVLVYTGTGRAGDQTLSGSNAQLGRQAELGYPLYTFAQTSSRRVKGCDNRRWMFLGLADLLRVHRETQVDAAGATRSVWVFELRTHAEPALVVIADDSEAATLARTLAPLRDDGDEATIAEAANSPQPAHGLSTIHALEPIRQYLLALEPRAFELFIGDLLRRTGFESVTVTRFSQDGGVDINACVGHSNWALRHLRLQVQAKRWLHTVGRKEVAELRGSLLPHAAGCIVTTSHFSRAAVAESQDAGKLPINLIDGYDLARWTQGAGLTPS
jgi:Restriction endonuclease